MTAKSLIRKSLNIFLVSVMAITLQALLTCTAFADEGNGGASDFGAPAQLPEEIPDDAVCAIGDTFYPSINAAKDSGDYSAPIILLKDVSEFVDFRNRDATWTIDLNGHEITHSGTFTFQVAAGHVIIEDSVGGGKISNTYAPGGRVSAAVYIRPDNYAGDLFTLNGGTIYSEREFGIYVSTGRVIINDGVIIGGNSSIYNWTLVDLFFKIFGGAFSDDAGNHPEKYQRPPDQYLAKGEDGLYRLINASAKIAETGDYYETIEGACAAAQSGQTVQLVKNVSENVVLRNKTLTLDLDRHTLSNEDNDHALYVYGNSNITVKNGTIARTGSEAGFFDTGDCAVYAAGGNTVLDGVAITSTKHGVYTDYQNATLKLVGNSTVTSASNYYPLFANHNSTIIVDEAANVTSRSIEAAHVDNGATLVVQGGTITSTGRNTVYALNEGKLAMSGGEVANTNNTGDAIYLESTAASSITGGSVTAKDGRAVMVPGGYGSLTIDDGQFTNNGSAPTIQAGDGSSTGSAQTEITINGGVVKNTGSGASAAVGDDASTFAITGGYFSDQAIKGEGFTLPEGKMVWKVNEGEYNGLYTLSDIVCTIGDTPYPSVNAAKDALNFSGPITLQKDTSEYVYFGANARSWTIDLNGHEITSSSVRTLFLGNNLTVTIMDSSEEGTGKVTNTYAGDGSEVPEPYKSCAIYMVADARTKLIVNSGTIQSDNWYGIYKHGSAVTINGGTIIGADGMSICSTSSVVGPFIINGGAFSDDVGNGEKYTRPDNQYLKLDDADGLYRLADVDKSELAQAVNDAIDPEVVVISEDDQDLPDGTNWAQTEEDKQAYADALAAAQEVLDNTKAIQSDVDNALAALREAAEKIKTVGVEKSRLAAAISAATDDKDATAVSDDGRDLADGVEYVSQSDKDTLASAIATAQEVYDKIDATQSEVDAARAALNEAKQAFDDAKQTASVDKSALEQAIAGATDDKDATSVSEDGNDLADGTEYVDQTTQDALTEAIAAAQAVADDPDATQNDVDAAKGALDEAKQAFDDAKKTASVDKTALEQALDDAAAATDGVEISEDGKDLKPDTEYTNQAAKDALDEAIAAAMAVVANPDATQTEVDEATEALNDAIAAYNDAKQTATVDKTALEQAIADATEDKDNTPVSEDGKDQPDGTEYVDQATQDALNDAIEAAQAVVDDPEATQNDVDAAKEAMDAAKQAFDDAKKTASVDKTVLNNNIKAAQDTQKNIKTSSDGKDVDPKDKYVTPAEKKALDDAIAAAKAVADKPDATQKEVDDAAAAVKAAQDKYDKAKKPGKKAAPVTTKTAIKSATAPAQKYTGKALKPAVTVKDANGKTVPASAYTVTYANNTNPGTATATIKAKADSKYTGSAKATFKITAAEQGVYWLVNKKTGENLYTTAIKEVNTLSKVKKTWINKGLMWYAPTVGEPIYRLYNPKTGDHHFTKSANEVRVLTKVRKTWKADFDGKPIFYSGGPKKIWRQYSESRWKANKPGTHKFTTYNAKLSGWKNEGALIDALRYGKVNGVK